MRSPRPSTTSAIWTRMASAGSGGRNFSMSAASLADWGPCPSPIGGDRPGIPFVNAALKALYFVESLDSALIRPRPGFYTLLTMTAVEAAGSSRSGCGAEGQRIVFYAMASGHVRCDLGCENARWVWSLAFD